MGAKLSVLAKAFAAKTEASCATTVMFDVCRGSPVCDFIRLMLFFFFFFLPWRFLLEPSRLSDGCSSSATVAGWLIDSATWKWQRFLHPDEALVWRWRTRDEKQLQGTLRTRELGTIDFSSHKLVEKTLSVSRSHRGSAWHLKEVLHV